MLHYKKDIITSFFGLNYIVLIVAFMWVGCSTLTNDSQEDLVTYEASQNSYSVGSLARTELENKSDESITYNFCFDKLEYKQNGKWISVGPQVVCQSYAETLSPGEKAQGGIILSDSLQLSEGSYRVTTDIGFLADEEGGQKTLTTQIFNINVKKSE